MFDQAVEVSLPLPTPEETPIHEIAFEESTYNEFDDVAIGPGLLFLSPRHRYLVVLPQYFI